jgi:PQQ-dependent catabolism-associated CXXCW motif protein
MAVLLLISLPVLSDDVPEPEGYWTGPVNSEVPHTVTGGTVIHTQGLAGLLKAGDTLLIDVSNAPVRPSGLAPEATWLPLPHDSIPGSLWIPGAGQGNVAPDVEQHFTALLAQKSAGNLDQPIVIYCHERCWLSWNAAKRAIRLGYRHVYWLPEGIEGWRTDGFKTEVVQPQEPRGDGIKK